MMPSAVMLDATSDSGMCEVTRAFQRLPSTLNSRAAPEKPMKSDTKRISSS